MVRHLQGHLIAGDKFETNFPESARTLLGPVWRVSQARGLLEFTGNSEDWLASKKNVKKHACKVRYAVRHLMRTGSTCRISGLQKSTARLIRPANPKHRLAAIIV